MSKVSIKTLFHKPRLCKACKGRGYNVVAHACCDKSGMFTDVVKHKPVMCRVCDGWGVST